MNNDRGLSSLEVLMSVGFLAALIIVCLNIFKKQQIELINAIQEIEITSTVNDIRLALKGEEACSATFENKVIGSRDVKVVKKVVQYPETNEIEEIEAFPLFQYGRKTFGTHDLKISDFRLVDPVGEKRSGERPIIFRISFDKGLPDLEEKNIVSREIKIYATTDNLGRVEYCSLGKMIIKSKKFESVAGHLKRETGNIGVGTNFVPSKMTINGGLLLRNKKTQICTSDSNGVIFFDNSTKKLSICHETKIYALSNMAVKDL
ncbi:MAG: hypothetical protein CME70_20390 [Halobacteriovorax sp.]|nr:hypothetical protein [Halobacteriovorax sp.]